MKFNVPCSVIAGAVSLAVSTSIAADDTKAPTLENIIVTGEQIDRRLLDTNTSVNVQTAEMLERASDNNIQDVLRRSASVVPTGAGVQSTDFSIRGISTSGVGSAGREGLGTIFIDDAATSRAQAALGLTSLFDVERIEILRGPQNTNRGKNSLAGAVIVETKKPEFEFNTDIKVGYGNYNRYQTAIANTGPITDTLAYRVTVDHQHSDGFIDNIVRDENDYTAIDSTSARIKLLYEAQDLPLNVLLSFTDFSSDTSNDIESYKSAGAFQSLNPYPSKMKNDQQLVTLHMGYQLNERWAFKTITTDNDFMSVDRTNTYATTMPAADEVWLAIIDQDEFSQELRATFNGDKLQATFGGYYASGEVRNARDGLGVIGIMSPFGPANLDVMFDNPVKTTTRAAFTELDYSVTDRLIVTAGLRYENLHFENANDGLITLQPAGVPFADLELEGDKAQSEVLPKIALNYALSDRQRIGATYTEGYRPGGVDLDINGGGVTTYDSEHTKNYELSYKGQLLENRLTVNANLFWIDWADMQTPGSSDIRSGTYNAGESTVYGGELEMNWYATDRLELFWAMGYAKTEFDDFVTGLADYTGNEFASAPELTNSIGGYWRFNDLQIGAEASYRDSYFDDISNSYEVASLTLVNFTAAYTLGQLELKGYINNAFDQVTQIRSDLVIEGEPLVLLSDPRTFGLSASVSF